MAMAASNSRSLTSVYKPQISDKGIEAEARWATFVATLTSPSCPVIMPLSFLEQCFWTQNLLNNFPVVKRSHCQASSCPTLYEEGGGEHDKPIFHIDG